VTETCTINVTKVKTLWRHKPFVLFIALCAVKVPGMPPPASFNNHATDGETSKVDNFIVYEIAYAVVEIGIACSCSVQCGPCFAFMAFHL